MVGKRLSKEERKKQIQLAAKKVILEKGYENTSMEDVITESGLSTGGLYHYYKSVYDIFYDIMLYGLEYGEHRNFEKNKLDFDTFIDYQMAKIFDDNEYKELFSILLNGIKYNENLRKMYTKLDLRYKEILHKNFKNSGLSEELLDDPFLVFFVHSLSLGFEGFAPIGSKECFRENKEVVRNMILSYIKEKYLNEEEKK